MISAQPAMPLNGLSIAPGNASESEVSQSTKAKTMSVFKTAAEKALTAGASKGLGHALGLSSSALLRKLPAALIVETVIAVSKESLAVVRKEKTVLQAADGLAEKSAEIGGATVGAAVGIAAVSAVGGGAIIATSVSIGTAYCLGVAGQKVYQSARTKLGNKVGQGKLAPTAEKSPVTLLKNPED